MALLRRHLTDCHGDVFSGTVSAIGSDHTNPIKNVEAIYEFAKYGVLHVKRGGAADGSIGFAGFS